jgi:ferric-dicitrate binding protein FerR (iron transport regulator)
MSTTRLEYLFHRYLNKQVTREESEELMLLIQQSAHDATIKQILDGVWNNLAVENRLSTEKADVLFNNILALSDSNVHETAVVPLSKRPVRRLFTLSRMIAAAIILLCITAGAYYWFMAKPVPKMVTNTGNPRYKNDISPGRNGALLTLSNGTQIQLDSAGNGNIAQEGNTNIVKIDSQLSYTVGTGVNATNLYNTVSTAKGNQYQLQLPDGSKVWLNAESSIRFPVMFSGKDRRVEITGEAYFDVKHNSQLPFVVAVNGFEVHDLGTQFNINAYTNETAVRTTLVEGKVSIEHGEATILKPGEPAEVNEKGRVKVLKGVDVEAAVAWKNGRFMFDNNNIQSVMRQLERWYNIEVVYSGNVSTEEFVGGVSRFGNISEVLTMLEKTGTVSFVIEGRKVIVK